MGTGIYLDFLAFGVEHFHIAGTLVIHYLVLGLGYSDIRFLVLGLGSNPALPSSIILLEVRTDSSSIPFVWGGLLLMEASHYMYVPCIPWDSLMHRQH